MPTYQAGRAFVIRPFGTKNTAQGSPIDFELVHSELIAPALETIGYSGGTTGEFIQQGNIHEDMFREIITADLVVADVSIHNANAFYELGIRHALRDKYTVIMRADSVSDKHVFDLNSERYVKYDLHDLSGSVALLVQVLRDTLAQGNSDSPVFRLLPGITKLDPASVVIVPEHFQEKVKRVLADEASPQDSEAASKASRLLALKLEATATPWEREGLRCVARAQSQLADHNGAIDTWEYLRSHDQFESEANQRLATAYQKTGKLIESEQAAQRSLKSTRQSDWHKAETYALIGSSIKRRWRHSLQDITDVKQRQKFALNSVLLEKSLKAYSSGFEFHRSHYYSGINAVAMLRIQLELAERHPNEWIYQCDNDTDDANSRRRKKSRLLTKLIAATDLAIESSLKNYRKDNHGWDEISAADLLLLTSSSPDQVKAAYSRYSRSIRTLNAAVLAEQIELYQLLDLFTANVNAVVEVIEELKEKESA